MFKNNQESHIQTKFKSPKKVIMKRDKTKLCLSFLAYLQTHFSEFLGVHNKNKISNMFISSIM